MTGDPPIRDAATILVIRDPASAPKVLMGQRGENAAFMPNKFVFPGGAVDALDHSITPAHKIAEPCRARLSRDGRQADGFAIAAIRELWEESGLILGAPGNWATPPPKDLIQFADTGFVPSAAGLHFVFRAITPPGRPRRFDARVFVVHADLIANDPDDFSRASDELSHLQWVPFADARQFDLPSITEVILAEVQGSMPHIRPPQSVPFFDNSDEKSLFRRLGGRSPLN